MWETELMGWYLLGLYDSLQAKDVGKKKSHIRKETQQRNEYKWMDQLK